MMHFIFVMPAEIAGQVTIVYPTLELNAPGINDQDDMCIWLNTNDSSLSTIIVSDKSADKLFVYDLEGNVLQTIDISGQLPGNIDIRYNFLLAGVPTDIIGYNRRSGSELVFYKVNRTTRQLSFAGSFASGSNYGFCLYKNQVKQKMYAFSSSESGDIRQYEITDNNSDGIIEGALVRQMDNGSGETEGMVAHDQAGFLYAADESDGIYKYDAEPNGLISGELIAATGSNGLTADVEGLTIYYASVGEAYLIASSQGSNNFKIYEGQSPHNFVKTIVVSGVGNTDGIDVANFNFGTLFPEGIFLVHDGTGSPFVIRGCRLEDLAINFVSANFQLAVSIQDGWNLVSIPGLHPVNQDILTWWSDKDPAANVFRFNGIYQAVNTTIPGEGYWMKHLGIRTYNTGEEWPAAGIQTVPNAPIGAVSGWNLIGGYEDTIATSEITTTPPGLITGPIYEYSNGYQVADNLVSGYGYWVKLSGQGTINLPHQLRQEKTDPAEYFKEEWGKIVLIDNAGKSFTLYAIKGEADLNIYELPPAPPSGMFDIRFTSGRIAEDLNNSIHTIELSGIEYPLKVKINNIELRLQDVSGEEINVIVRSGEEITINNTAIKKLRVSEEIIPGNYSLEQNYPNPFNPVTTISYTLSEAGEVRLTIYNILGEEVAALVSGFKDAGKHTVDFDASRFNSGLYIYKLEAGSFIQVKKMILLK